MSGQPPQGLDDPQGYGRLPDGLDDLLESKDEFSLDSIGDHGI